MKAMCIKQGDWVYINTGKIAPGNHPKYGDIVTILREQEKRGSICLILLEFPYPEGYLKRWFIPCSEIDETELIAEREAVGVCQ